MHFSSPRFAHRNINVANSQAAITTAASSTSVCAARIHGKTLALTALCKKLLLCLFSVSTVGQMCEERYLERVNPQSFGISPVSLLCFLQSQFTLSGGSKQLLKIPENNSPTWLAAKHSGAFRRCQEMRVNVSTSAAFGFCWTDK